jgi:hypothetical protein
MEHRSLGRIGVDHQAGVLLGVELAVLVEQAVARGELGDLRAQLDSCWTACCSHGSAPAIPAS